MGLSITTNPPTTATQSQLVIHKFFLLSNYLLLASASGCIFLTLALRLIPSLPGALLILLQLLTIAGAVFGCAAVSAGSNNWYAAHMVSTVLTAIFQGSVSVLVFTTTSDFLRRLDSYVREEDGDVILRVVGGLCVATFCLEWVVLGLAFVLRYHAFVEGNVGSGPYFRPTSAKVQDDGVKPMPFQPFQV